MLRRQAIITSATTLTVAKVIAEGSGTGLS